MPVSWWFVLHLPDSPRGYMAVHDLGVGFHRDRRVTVPAHGLDNGNDRHGSSRVTELLRKRPWYRGGRGVFLALLIGIALGGCTFDSEEVTATATSTPTPIATESPIPTPTPTDSPTPTATREISPEQQALIDLVPEDAEATLLEPLLSLYYRMAGYRPPVVIFTAPDATPILTDVQAVTDGATVEVTFGVSGAPTGFERIDYWMSVGLSAEERELPPLLIHGMVPSEPEAQAYVHAANDGVYYYEAAVEYVDELTRRITVRIPPGWAKPVRLGLIVGAQLDPNGFLFQVGSRAKVTVTPVEHVETRGLPEPGPITPRRSLLSDPDELWQGTPTTWSHPGVHATVEAPDDWLGHSGVDRLELWGWEPDASGHYHLVYVSFMEFDPASRTPTQILDEILTLSEGGYEELGRITDETLAFDETVSFETVREFEIAADMTPALPSGWQSGEGWYTFLGIVALPDGRMILAIAEALPEVFDLVLPVMSTIEITP